MVKKVKGKEMKRLIIVTNLFIFLIIGLVGIWVGKMWGIEVSTAFYFFMLSSFFLAFETQIWELNELLKRRKANGKKTKGAKRPR